MTTCRICADTRDHARFTVPELMYGTGERFEYFECCACGCLQLVEIPANLGRYYPADYYSLGGHELGAESRLRRIARKLRARHYLHSPNIVGALLEWSRGPCDYLTWMRDAGVDEHARVLDVGSGGGRVLRFLRRDGFAELTGADPFLREEVDEPGLRIVRRDISQLHGAYELVLLNHSFEHVPEPHGVLAHARRLLAPGGTVLVRIPMAGSYAHRHYGVHWVNLDAPRHLHLHTRRSLQLCAERAGLRVRKVVFDGDEHGLLGSEQYARGIPMRDPRSYTQGAALFSAAEIARMRTLARACNAVGDGDAASFYLERT